ncbi:hypothetical protein ACJZ2D_012607 [Fusarium nematophilum]
MLTLVLSTQSYGRNMSRPLNPAFRQDAQDPLLCDDEVAEQEQAQWHEPRHPSSSRLRPAARINADTDFASRRDDNIAIDPSLLASTTLSPPPPEPFTPSHDA